MSPRHTPDNFRLWRWGTCILLASLLVLAAGSNAINNKRHGQQDNAALWRPRFATPAIVALDNETNREFIAEVKASTLAHNWSATIANDLKEWPCQIVSATYSTINNGSEPGWRIKISVPPDASPELFTLKVACN
jgi:hypothetical protein